MDSPRTWRAAPRRLHAWVAWPWWSPATKCSGAGTERNGRTKRNRKWSKCRGYGWFMADLGWFMLIYGWFMSFLFAFFGWIVFVWAMFTIWDCWSGVGWQRAEKTMRDGGREAKGMSLGQRIDGWWTSNKRDWISPKSGCTQTYGVEYWLTVYFSERPLMGEWFLL